MNEKKCTKCGETKPLDGFAKNRNRRDGLNGWCKECLRQWRIDNKERHAKRKADYYYSNRESILARSKEWRERNAEVVAQKKAAYRLAHRDAHLERDRLYRAANIDRARERERQYNVENPHVRWVYGYRKRCEGYGVTPIVDDFTKADVIERHGDSCFYCETGEFENLDHFVPVKAGGPHTLENVRPSCFSCNRAKADADPDEWLAEQAALDDLTEGELDDLIDAEIDRWTK